jgi:hypothetical protein
MWNLNNDYSIVESGHSQLLNNNFLDLFVSLMIWYMHQSLNHSLFLISVFCGFPNAHSPPLLKTSTWSSSIQKENSYTQPNFPLFTPQTSSLWEEAPKCYVIKTLASFCNYERKKWGLHFGSNDGGVYSKPIFTMYMKKP